MCAKIEPWFGKPCVAGAEGLEVDGEMRWDSQGEPGCLVFLCVMLGA